MASPFDCCRKAVHAYSYNWEEILKSLSSIFAPSTSKILLLVPFALVVTGLISSKALADPGTGLYSEASWTPIIVLPILRWKISLAYLVPAMKSLLPSSKSSHQAIDRA